MCFFCPFVLLKPATPTIITSVLLEILAALTMAAGWPDLPKRTDNYFGFFLCGAETTTDWENSVLLVRKNRNWLKSCCVPAVSDGNTQTCRAVSVLCWRCRATVVHY